MGAESAGEQIPCVDVSLDQHNNKYTNYRGEVINGGFGLVLDGTEEAAERAKMMLSWDVLNGVSPLSLHLHCRCSA